MNAKYFCHDFFFLNGCTSKDNIIFNNTDELQRDHRLVDHRPKKLVNTGEI